MTSRTIGIRGEDQVVEYLLNRDYEVLERNYRYKRNEIDIITKKNNMICFVEVKKRVNNDFGYPETFVSEGQRQRIHLAAENFILSKNWDGNIRFDIAAVSGNDIDYFEDAF